MSNNSNVHVNNTDTRKKTTRRRLRVSCTECTRRRQKCDREQPCGSCKSRGVKDKCHWPVEPYQRPAPARLPSDVSSIEKEPPLHSSGDKGFTMPPSPSAQCRIMDQNHTHLSTTDRDMKEAALALTQLSVARTEDAGRGLSPRAPDEAGLHSSTDSMYAGSWSSQSTDTMHKLLTDLPSKSTCDLLTFGFFEKNNWRIGVPQPILMSEYNRMWHSLQADPSDAQRVCIEWLTLLYAIFACSVSTLASTESSNAAREAEDQRRGYFLRSLSGRRIIEDTLCASFSHRPPRSSAADSIYSCLAAILLASFISDRGNISEAWKMISGAVRIAQSIGLHRDPVEVQRGHTDTDVQELRRTTWQVLCLRDGLLSFMLGRPAVIRPFERDMPLPKPHLTLNGDTDTELIYKACMTGLTAISSESGETFSSVGPSLYASVLKMDKLFDAWEQDLPPYLSCRTPDTSFDVIYPNLPRQRCGLAITYFASRMNLHRPFILPDPPVLRAPRSLAFTVDLNPSRSKCTAFAHELMNAECAMRACPSTRPDVQPGFMRTFFVFDAAVTFYVALLHYGEHTQAHEWRDAIALATRMLEDDREADAGYVVRQALRVLEVLERAVHLRTDPLARGAHRLTSHSIPTSDRAAASSLLLSTAPGPSTFPTGRSESATFEPPVKRMIDLLRGGSTAYELLHGVDGAGEGWFR